MRGDDLAGVSTAELEMALSEWRRWRNRVRFAKDMRLRRERDEQACGYITAIEHELTLRTPEVRERMLQQTTAALEAVVHARTIPLDVYRSLRRELATIEKRDARPYQQAPDGHRL